MLVKLPPIGREQQFTLPETAMSSKKRSKAPSSLDAFVIGRKGPQTPRKAGPHEDRRTKRLRTRSAVNDQEIGQQTEKE